MAKRLPSAVFKCAAPRDAPSAVAAVPDLQLQERRQRLHIHELMLHVRVVFVYHTVQAHLHAQFKEVSIREIAE
jgi:hypothetical protein